MSRIEVYPRELVPGNSTLLPVRVEMGLATVWGQALVSVLELESAQVSALELEPAQALGLVQHNR